MSLLVDQAPGPEAVVAAARTRHHLERSVSAAVEALGDRERVVARLRLLAEIPTPVDAVARALGVSAARIPDIEARARRRLRHAVRRDLVQAA